MARAAQTYSTARIRRTLSITLRSFRTASHAIDTWSSCMPEVGRESTEAGAARRLLSDAMAAAV